MNPTEEKIHSTNEKILNEIVSSQLTFGRLVFLVIIAVVLSSVGLVSIFAPVPLSLAFLLFGRAKVFGVSAVVLVILFGLGGTIARFAEFFQIGVIYTTATVFAVFISHIVFSNQHPVAGMLKSGSLMLLGIVVLLGTYAVFSSVSIEEQVLSYVSEAFRSLKAMENYQNLMQAGGEEARAFQDFLEKPELVVQSIMNWSFAATFVGVFFGVWMGLFMVLRNTIIWKRMHGYKFGLKDLTSFQVPFSFIYPLIIGLVLILLDELAFKSAHVVGMNIIYCLGVFYFFQGFGVFIQLMDHLRIKGFFRSVFVIMTIVVAYRVVAIVGLLNQWIDFGKFFEKQKD